MKDHLPFKTNQTGGLFREVSIILGFIKTESGLSYSWYIRLLQAQWGWDKTAAIFADNIFMDENVQISN